MCFKEVFLPCYSVLSIEEPTYFSPQARLGLTGPWGKCEGRLQFTELHRSNPPHKKKYPTYLDPPSPCVRVILSDKNLLPQLLSLILYQSVLHNPFLQLLSSIYLSFRLNHICPSSLMFPWDFPL